ncbi:hypothetical protein EDD11_009714 [Mortierella claussenii]|nr:hypothetical protein EDD11_009714 [Mortierella claussenii]
MLKPRIWLMREDQRGGGSWKLPCQHEPWIANSLFFLLPIPLTTVWQHGALPRPAPGTGFKVNFVKQDGETVTVEANDGESLLDVARANDLDVEGACEASLACSTCHLILDEASFDKLEEPSDEENDMLDLAFGLTDTSRLGCQVLMCKELDGLTAKIPSATRNMYVDGAKPKHH